MSTTKFNSVEIGITFHVLLCLDLPFAYCRCHFITARKMVRYISLVQWSYASKKEEPLGFFLVHISGTLSAFLEGCNL